MHLLWTFPPYATHFNTKVKKEKKKKSQHRIEESVRLKTPTSMFTVVLARKQGQSSETKIPNESNWLWHFNALGYYYIVQQTNLVNSPSD